MKKALLAAAALMAVPVAANAQSMWSPGPSNPGIYIGGEGGLNWLLNSNNYNMDLGFAAGGVVGYDFVGPRVELEGVFRSNNGRGTANFGNIFSNTSGRIEQLAIMANLLYDFIPGATVTPYIGAGAGIAFADSSINGCSMCSTQFAYQGIVGLGWNVDQNFRVNLDGRYYGTTNPGMYQNNNITTMLSVAYKFGGPAAAPPPPPAAAPVTPPSFMVFFDWDRANLSDQALTTIRQAASAYKQKGNARITRPAIPTRRAPRATTWRCRCVVPTPSRTRWSARASPATNIAVLGRGEQGLLVQTGPNVREPQNRRVEIVIQ
jgi:OOP family OmpA-OmpF porin